LFQNDFGGGEVGVEVGFRPVQYCVNRACMEEASFLVVEVFVLGGCVNAACLLSGRSEGFGLCFVIVDAVFLAIAAVPDGKVELP